MVERFIQKYAPTNSPERKVAIWGLGREGLSALEFFRKHLPTKIITLVAPEKPDDLTLDRHSIFIPEQDFFENHLTDIDVIVKSPGISLYCEYAQKAKAAHILMTSVTNIWFSLDHKTTTIAITGSNGKSTVSSLLYHILKTLGISAELGGNIGTALLNLSGQSDYTVIELSSYQTADFKGKADLAILLNLFPEHLDWHHSHAQYFIDKVNLLRYAHDYILNKTDPRSAKINLPKAKYFNDPMGMHIQDGAIYQGDRKLLEAAECKIIGSHNLENISAALKACEYFGIDLKKASRAAQTFTGLPHRLEFLGKRDDFYYVNDSISTTPEAASAAIKALTNYKVTIILGGEDREQNFSSLVQTLKNTPHITVITTYETGPRLNKAIALQAPNVRLYSAGDLTQAQHIAVQETPKEGLILLSPAAPSYDGFKNFEERGDTFKGNI